METESGLSDTTPDSQTKGQSNDTDILGKSRAQTECNVEANGLKSCKLFITSETLLAFCELNESQLRSIIHLVIE